MFQPAHQKISTMTARLVDSHSMVARRETPAENVISQSTLLESCFKYQSRQIVVRSPTFQQLLEGVVPKAVQLAGI